MRLIKEFAFAAALTIASLMAIATGHAGDIIAGSLTIGHPWSRQSPMAADVSAGYLTITNNGTADDRLTKVASDISAMVQLHDMKMENDMMKMVELPDGVPLPAGQTVELKPKSLHVMFMGVKAQPKAGSTFKATLTFEKAGPVEVEFHVMAPGEAMN